MFGKKKDERPKREHRDRNLAQYGLFDVPSQLSFDNEGDDDDDDLEAELLAITSDKGAVPRKKPKPKPIPQEHLDALVANSLRDIPSDEDLSGDDDDPELLSELSEITEDKVESVEQDLPVAKQEDDIVAMLEKRLEMYNLAEANAKKTGETSRARRFGRGVKQLRDLIKQANMGKPINPEDIPPEVSTGENRPVAPTPVRPAPEIPEPEPEPKPEAEKSEDSEKTEIINMLTNRMNEYKKAAVISKRNGQIPKAIGFVKVGKQFDIVIKAVLEGQEVDLSAMPGPPDLSDDTIIKTDPDPGPSQSKVENETQSHSEEPEPNVETEPEPEPELINPSNLLDGLTQRMGIYKTQEENAKTEGNSSKARRMGRIIKQYEQAIKAHKLGKPVPLDELPNPPGYAPLVPPQTEPEKPPEPSNEPEPQKEDKPLPPPRASSVRKMGNQSTTTHNERQINLLLLRQREFKEAALEAKKKGEIAQAKEFLRAAKGFEKVIEASRCGLPVDMESLPIPPNARSQLEDSYDIVIAEECTEDDTGALDMLSRLEEQLTKQLKMCLSTRDHHKALGDVAGTNRFEHLALSVTKDLDIVRYAHRTNTGTMPKFHYEIKSFSVVKCCTDLNDNDFELTIVRGINFNCTNPKDIDTYVKFEFPYPQEEPVKDRTSTIKDTNNPEYNATFTLPIQRTARPCLRVFKRQAVKFEVYSKGGFFRGDTLLGTVNIKLQPLETQCELHDSYDLMDNRKKVGGKLEIRMRVRNPMVTKQIEQLNEKWLVIDQ